MNLLSILAVLNYAVVWMVPTRPPIFKSPSPFNNPLLTVPKALITIGIIVTSMFHSFFNFLIRSRYLFSFHFPSVLFCGQPGQQSPQFYKLSSFVVDYYKVWSSGRDLVIVCMSKSHRSLCVSFSRTDARLCIYHLFVWSNFNFLHISQWITLPTQSCLV